MCFMGYDIIKIATIANILSSNNINFKWNYTTEVKKVHSYYVILMCLSCKFLR